MIGFDQPGNMALLWESKQKVDYKYRNKTEKPKQALLKLTTCKDNELELHLLQSLNNYKTPLMTIDIEKFAGLTHGEKTKTKTGFWAKKPSSEITKFYVAIVMVDETFWFEMNQAEESWSKRSHIWDKLQFVNSWSKLKVTSGLHGHSYVTLSLNRHSLSIMTFSQEDVIPRCLKFIPISKVEVSYTARTLRLTSFNSEYTLENFCEKLEFDTGRAKEICRMVEKSKTQKDYSLSSTSESPGEDLPGRQNPPFSRTTSYPSDGETVYPASTISRGSSWVDQQCPQLSEISETTAVTRDIGTQTADCSIDIDKLAKTVDCPNCGSSVNILPPSPTHVLPPSPSHVLPPPPSRKHSEVHENGSVFGTDDDEEYSSIVSLDTYDLNQVTNRMSITMENKDDIYNYITTNAKQIYSPGRRRLQSCNGCAPTTDPHEAADRLSSTSQCSEEYRSASEVCNTIARILRESDKTFESLGLSREKRDKLCILLYLDDPSQLRDWTALAEKVGLTQRSVDVIEAFIRVHCRKTAAEIVLNHWSLTKERPYNLKELKTMLEEMGRFDIIEAIF